MQKRRELENEARGFGTSMHFSPLRMSLSQPWQLHFLPAVAVTGLPAEPLINEGILFFDILDFLELSGEIIKNVAQAGLSGHEFLCRPFDPFPAIPVSLRHLLVHHLQRTDEIVISPDAGF